MPNIGLPEIFILLVLVGVPALIVMLVVRASRSSGKPAAGPGILPPGWFVDPTGRHAHRYWDGVRWSAYVADGGVQAQDPL
jgi:Protein of unknown function (DUF2510)